MTYFKPSNYLLKRTLNSQFLNHLPPTFGNKQVEVYVNKKKILLKEYKKLTYSRHFKKFRNYIPFRLDTNKFFQLPFRLTSGSVPNLHFWKRVAKKSLFSSLLRSKILLNKNRIHINKSMFLHNHYDRKRKVKPILNLWSHQNLLLVSVFDFYYISDIFNVSIFNKKHTKLIKTQLPFWFSFSAQIITRLTGKNDFFFNMFYRKQLKFKRLTMRVVSYYCSRFDTNYAVKKYGSLTFMRSVFNFIVEVGWVQLEKAMLKKKGVTTISWPERGDFLHKFGFFKDPTAWLDLFNLFSIFRVLCNNGLTLFTEVSNIFYEWTCFFVTADNLQSFMKVFTNPVSKVLEFSYRGHVWHSAALYSERGSKFSTGTADTQDSTADIFSFFTADKETQGANGSEVLGGKNFFLIDGFFQITGLSNLAGYIFKRFFRKFKADFFRDYNYLWDSLHSKKETSETSQAQDKKYRFFSDFYHHVSYLKSEVNFFHSSMHNINSKDSRHIFQESRLWYACYCLLLKGDFKDDSLILKERMDRLSTLFNSNYSNSIKRTLKKIKEVKHNSFYDTVSVNNDSLDMARFSIKNVSRISKQRYFNNLFDMHKYGKKRNPVYTPILFSEKYILDNVNPTNYNSVIQSRKSLFVENRAKDFLKVLFKNIIFNKYSTRYTQITDFISNSYNKRLKWLPVRFDRVQNSIGTFISPFFVAYKEINYRISSVSLMHNILNDRVDLIPDISHLNIKIVLSGLYRNY